MSSTPRSPKHRHAWIAVAALLLTACASQIEPAQRSISDIEAALDAAQSDAAKYVPDQLTDVRRELSDLQASFDRRDYAAVLAAAPAVRDRAKNLGGAAAARKAELMQALGEEWSGLASRLPDYMTAIQNRIEFLAKKSNRKTAAGIDLDAARGSLSEAASVWSKAQAAFAIGNLGEAVTTAKTLGTSLQGLAGTLKVDLKS
jgi:hypothetical protein